MAEGFDLGNFSLFGGDTPDLGASIPSSGFNLYGAGGAPGGGFDWGALNLGGGGAKLDTSGMPSPATGGFDLGAPAPNAGGGWWNNLGGGLNKTMDFIGSAAKPVSQIAGLGTAGVGIANAIMGMQQGRQMSEAQKQAMGTQRQISNAVLPSATQLTQGGASAMLGGPLPPGLQAQVDDFKRKSKAEINQYLSHAGIADSTMMAQWDAYIEQQSVLYGQQLAAGLYSQGIQGLGTAGTGASALASTATQMGAGVPSSISDANKALSKLAAMS